MGNRNPGPVRQNHRPVDGGYQPSRFLSRYNDQNPRPDGRHGTKDRRWGRFVTEKGAVAIEAGAAALAAKYLFPDALKDLREGLYMTRHAGKTGIDAVLGGPEGMRAALSLEEALDMVEKASDQNEQCAQVLQGYLAHRKEFVTQVVEVYRLNETFERISDRLTVQLKGAGKQFFEVGNDIKAEWWKENIDTPIVLNYGRALRALGKSEYKNLSDEQIITKALESSAKLKKFYTEARKFYDAREKSEDTVAQFCTYLEKCKNTSVAQNKRMEEAFPQIVKVLNEGYTVEDLIFETDGKGTGMTREDIKSVNQNVTGYHTHVDETRESVGKAVPLDPYREWNYVDVVTNPFMIGAAAALLVKGSLRAISTKADNVVSWAVSTPFRLAGNAASWAYDKISEKYINYQMNKHN